MFDDDAVISNWSWRQVKGLPFNKYTWLVTHNSFSIVNEPSFTGTPRVTFFNQEDSVTNQLRVLSCFWFPLL